MTDKRKDIRGRILRSGESQLSDGRYRYRYTDQLGQRQTVYSWKLLPTDRIPKDKKCLKSLREMEIEISQELLVGINQNLAKIKLLDYIERYLSTKGNLKESSKETYRHLIQTMLSGSVLANKQVGIIKKTDIIRFYRELNQKYAKRTIETLNHVIYPTFELALEEGAIGKNPCRNCMKEIASDEKKEKIILTVQQQEFFLDWLKKNNEKLYLMYSIFLGTACRVGEVLGLTWADIDMKEKMISINHQLKYGRKDGSNRRYIDSVKTRNSVRTIPMTKHVYECLCRQRELDFKMRANIREEIDGYSDFVFLSAHGTTLLPKNVSNQLYKTVQKINEYEKKQAEVENREPFLLPPIRIHALRHTACTRMIEAGMSVKTVQYIMGHADVNITLNVYAHSNLDQIKKEMWNAEAV